MTNNFKVKPGTVRTSTSFTFDNKDLKFLLLAVLQEQGHLKAETAIKDIYLTVVGDRTEYDGDNEPGYIVLTCDTIS